MYKIGLYIGFRDGGRVLMREELELKLHEEFEFVWQNNVEEEKRLYRRWGCECFDGWYGIIHDCCKQIEGRYS